MSLLQGDPVHDLIGGEHDQRLVLLAMQV